MSSETASLLTEGSGKATSADKRPAAYLILDTEIFYQFCDKEDQGKLEANATAASASTSNNEIPVFGTGKPIIDT